MRVRLTVTASRCRTPDRARRSDGIRSRTSHAIGVPKETAAGQHRVALVPEVVGKLKAKGLEVVVQDGAGADALLPDSEFARPGRS